MDAGGMVQPVIRTVVHAVARAREEGVGLVGAGAVGRGVDPPGSVLVVVVFIVVGVVVVFLARPRDGLWQRVVAEVPLKVEEPRVLFQEAAVAGVWRQVAPLGVCDRPSPLPLPFFPFLPFPFGIWS